MALYDHGGGCPCGLQKECDCSHQFQNTAGYRNCPDCQSSGYDSPDYYCTGGKDCRKQKQYKEKQDKMAVKDLDTSFDFGFSTVSENELESIKELEKKASELENVKTSKEQEAQVANEKVNKMYKAILPLLNNLEKDPDRPYIYWPDRQKKIEQFKKMLLQIVDNS